MRTAEPPAASTGPWNEPSKRSSRKRPRSLRDWAKSPMSSSTGGCRCWCRKAAQSSAVSRVSSWAVKGPSVLKRSCKRVLMVTLPDFRPIFDRYGCQPEPKLMALNVRANSTDEVSGGATPPTAYVSSRDSSMRTSRARSATNAQPARTSSGAHTVTAPTLLLLEPQLRFDGAVVGVHGRRHGDLGDGPVGILEAVAGE